MTTPDVLGHYRVALYDPNSGVSRMDWRPCGGETFSEVIDRVQQFLSNVEVSQTSSPPNLLLVSHGNVLRLFLAMAQGHPEPDLRIPANASILVLDVERTDHFGFLSYEVVQEPDWDES